MGLCLRRKDNSHEAALICAGRLFHARAAATGKLVVKGVNKTKTGKRLSQDLSRDKGAAPETAFLAITRILHSRYPYSGGQFSA